MAIGSLPPLEGVSLFKLDISSPRINQLKAFNKLSEIISSIVQLYDSQVEEYIRFNSPISLDEEKLNALDRHRFSVQWYISVRRMQESGPSKTLAALAESPDELDLGKVTEHHLIFLYKSCKMYKQNKKIQKSVRSIFVLATNKAYLVIRHFVDYGFTMEMVSRLCSPYYFSKSRVNLSGKSLATSDVFKRKVPLQYSVMESLSELIKGFDTELKPHASIYTLEAFSCFVKTEGKKKINAPVKLTAGEMYIRFHHRFDLNGYFEICQHLLRVEIGFEEEDKDPIFEYLDNIKRVPKSDENLIGKLQTLLIANAYEVFNGKSSTQLEFYHHHYKDYFKSSSYVLREKQKQTALASWNTPPNPKDILDVLRKKYKCRTFPEFCITLKKLKLDFFYGTKQSHSLDQYFKGEIQNEGIYYFHLDGTWCRVQAEFYSIIQHHFLDAMGQAFLGKKDKGYLPIPWVNNKSWCLVSLAESKDPIWNNLIKELKEASFHYVNSTGIVQDLPLDRYFCQLSFIKEYVPKLKNFLEKNVGKKITTKDLKKIGIDDPTKVLHELKRKRLFLKPHGDDDDDYVVRQDPSKLPSSLKDALGDSLLDKLIENWGRFENYRAKEEDYNRNYFFSNFNKDEKPFTINEGYLVFDQVFVNDELKIELFDIAYYTSEKIFLYHVKCALGQHTRDACSQIRNAAAALESAIKIGGNSDLLAAVFDSIYDSNSKSFLLQKVKEQLQAFGKTKKAAKQAFLSLFKDRKIVLVYAFLDSATEERDLGAELQREYQFTEKSFNDDECTTYHTKRIFTSKEILMALIEEEYLDKRGKLTDKFIKINSLSAFKPKFLGTKQKNIKAVYNILSSALSQYQSFIAKKELIDTKKYVESLGFEFRICQIYRDGKPCKTFQPSFYATTVSKLVPTLQMQNLFQFRNSIYEKKMTVADGACALHALNGEENKKGCVESFSKAANSQKATKQDYLDLIEENIKNKNIRTKLINFFENLFKDYLQGHASNEAKAIYANFHLTKMWKTENEKLFISMRKAKAERNKLIWVYITSLERKKLKLYLQVLRNSKKVWASLSSKELFKEIKKEGIDKILDGCMNELNTLLPDDEFSSDHVDDLLKKSNTYLSKQIEKNLKELLTIYSKQLLHSSFYMSELELEIAALLYEKKVLLLFADQKGDVDHPRYFNCDEDDEVDVVIVNEQNPDHYSQCVLSDS